MDYQSNSPLLLHHAQQENEISTSNCHSEEDNNEQHAQGAGEEAAIVTDWTGRAVDECKGLGGWSCALCVVGAYGFLNAALYGIISNLVLYLVNVWGQNNSEAANSVTALSGTAFLCSFIGAFASDAFVGRLWGTIIFGAMTFASIFFCSVVTSLTSSNAVRTWFFLSLYVMALASGSMIPNVLSLGADQLDVAKDKARYFTLCAISCSVAQIYATTAVTWVEQQGLWAWGYWMCTVAAGAAFGLSACVITKYRQFKASGSPLKRIAQVLVACFRHRIVSLPSHPSLLHEVPGKLSAIPGCRKLPHTNSFRFLDRAAIVKAHEKKEMIENAWQVCTVTQVEELKCLIRVIPVGLASMSVAMAAAQVSTFFEEQAALTNRKAGVNIAPATMQLFSIGASIVMGTCHNAGWTRPLYWCINMGRTSEATSLQMQGVSMVSAILGLVMAAVIESHRLELAHAGLLMCILWLIPQYIFLGIATNIMSAGSFDFFYTEVSDGMRTISSAIALLFFGAGNYLSTILVIILNFATSDSWIASDLNNGHLDCYYWFLAAFVAFVFLMYLVYSHYYSYNKFLTL